MMGRVQEEMIMTDRQPPRPTDSELAILGVLWERGPSTVRDVQEQLNKDGATGYTTVLKLLQIMTEKGLVVRDESERAHVYESRYGEQKTQRQLLTDLAERAFGGSATKLVMQALSGRKANAAELTAIRELLDTLEGESR
jgi:predicted transcriptional regulator